MRSRLTTFLPSPYDVARLMTWSSSIASLTLPVSTSEESAPLTLIPVSSGISSASLACSVSGSTVTTMSLTTQRPSVLCSTTFMEPVLLPRKNSSVGLSSVISVSATPSESCAACRCCRAPPAAAAPVRLRLVGRPGGRRGWLPDRRRSAERRESPAGSPLTCPGSGPSADRPPPSVQGFRAGAAGVAGVAGLGRHRAQVPGREPIQARSSRRTRPQGSRRSFLSPWLLFLVQQHRRVRSSRARVSRCESLPRRLRGPGHTGVAAWRCTTAQCGRPAWRPWSRLHGRNLLQPEQLGSW